MPLALVTGAAVRVGRAIAEALLDAGYDLIATAHGSFAALPELAFYGTQRGRKVSTYALDLTDEAMLDSFTARIREEVPALDLLVHNAGGFERSAIDDISRDQWRAMQALNVEAPFFLTQGLLQTLRAARAPSIVHLADIAGDRPMIGYAHYSVSKAALVMLTKALALELAPDIRVNAIAPGAVQFPPNFDEDQKHRILARVPMRHEGSPSDVAKAVLFLARDAPYVTGHVLAVDGGRSARL